MFIILLLLLLLLVYNSNEYHYHYHYHYIHYRLINYVFRTVLWKNLFYKAWCYVDIYVLVIRK